jgi:hypothetical protein
MLKVLENRVLWRIFGPRRDEVTGGWRKFNNEELHSLYSLPDIIGAIKSRRMRWKGHVARIVEMKNEHKIFVGKPEGTRPHASLRHRWEDNIKMDLSK